jgi:glucose-1-phosphate cytidylyltransferase
MSDNRIEFLDEFKNNWNITFVDTGVDTQTGARIKIIEKYITGDTFFVTYGDGIGDIDIDKLLEYHIKMDRIATVTGVYYQSQYGVLTVKKGVATAFKEKPLLNLTINAGFFVFNKSVFQYLTDDKRCTLESTLLKKLTAIDELAVYKHDGYWIGIDTFKDLLNARQNAYRFDK